jgi:hypothetical protein
MAKASKADTFAVWGRPPSSVAKVLGPNSEKALKRYVDDVVSRCYRIAYDCGYSEGARDEYEAMKTYFNR